MAELAKVMKMSERIGDRGSVSLFMSCVRLMMPLFSVTHKTDYMRLCCNLLLWWHCASPVEQRLFEDYIFTQLNANGNPIFSDLLMEMSVMHIRQILGKVYRVGMELAMEHATDAIPKRSSKDLSSNTLRNKDYEPPLRSSKTMDIIDENSPLVKAFKKIMNMRLWDAEGLPPLLAFQDNDPVYAEATSLRIPLGKGKGGKGKDKTCVLSPALLSAYKTGCIRTRNYFIAHYCRVNDRVERSEKLVSLAKIPSTAEKTKQQRDRRIKMATSVDAGEIKKLFKIAEIIEEIKLLNSEDHGVVFIIFHDY